MPAFQIQLAFPGEALTLGPFAAILDTGADGTLVPQPLLNELEAPSVDHIRVRSHWGEWHVADLFTVDVGFDGLRLPAVEVAGDDCGTEIILGRNVVNQLRLLLDGPAGQAEILDL